MKKLDQQSVRKNLVRFAFALLLISMINHWPDIKQGIVDGFSAGISVGTK